jgi:hypothetical protein
MGGKCSTKRAVGNTNKIFVGNLNGKTIGRPRHIWEDNTKMYLKSV